MATSVMVFGKDVPKRIIKRVDIIKYLPDSSDGKPETFWKALLNTENPITETLDKIYKRDRGLGAKARATIDEAILLHLSHYADSIKYSPILDSIAENILIGSSGMVRLYDFEKLTANAFAAPNGNVVIYRGLQNLFSWYREELLTAVIAHEIVHVLLKHSLVQEYMQRKNERNSMIWASVAVGLQAFADGMNSAYTGKTVNNTAYYASIFNSAKYESFMYQFKYSREIELQADIVAFRLLDWIGIGGERMKEALTLLADPFEYSSDLDNHYTMSQRIAVLGQLEKGPRVKREKPLASDEMKKTRADSQKLIESSSRNVEIKVGETIRLKTLSGDEASWISKDTSVVRVYSDGRVKGLSTGLAMVWAHLKDSDTPELHAVSVVN
ncbi:MAG: M48 family metalloprotease [Bacteroidales bacterium]|nr:M48 family metalloprotease [Bacteroidales bacterium]